MGINRSRGLSAPDRFVAKLTAAVEMINVFQTANPFTLIVSSSFSPPFNFILSQSKSIKLKVSEIQVFSARDGRAHTCRALSERRQKKS